jgi:hypothetical protein
MRSLVAKRESPKRTLARSYQYLFCRRAEDSPRLLVSADRSMEWRLLRGKHKDEARRLPVMQFIADRLADAIVGAPWGVTAAEFRLA